MPCLFYNQVIQAPLLVALQLALTINSSENTFFRNNRFLYIHPLTFVNIVPTERFELTNKFESQKSLNQNDETACYSYPSADIILLLQKR
jgi:hypothetical protein